jgi:hypothetical protein
MKELLTKMIDYSPARIRGIPEFVKIRETGL